jgi:hypothetical protein
MDPVGLESLRFPPDCREGWLGIVGLDLPVRFLLGVPTDGELSPDYPAMFVIAPDCLSLMVWVHESVPPFVERFAVMHEILEGKIRFESKVDAEVAHRIALAFERTIAREELAPGEFESYDLWRRGVPDHSRPLREILAPLMKE